MGRLIRDGSVQSPVQVKHELKRNVNELSVLFRQNRGVFQNNGLIMQLSREITGNHPCIMDSSKKIDADPYIVALVLKIKRHTVDRPIIVTHESPSKDCNIPSTAKAYRIKSVKLLELFELEGWHFD